jgi:hypothetical protein
MFSQGWLPLKLSRDCVGVQLRNDHQAVAITSTTPPYRRHIQPTSALLCPVQALVLPPLRNQRAHREGLYIWAPAEIAMFQISEVQESPAFNGRRRFLTLRERDREIAGPGWYVDADGLVSIPSRRIACIIRGG